ncbi:MAG: hydrogenase maturation protease [Syntrophomonadaceae bacterium]|nr:hydrogenase maturation protease [Syntrophomonadaceae bacterium]
MKRTLIVGIGNLLLKDEGVGVHVVNRLERVELPPGVEVVDGGTHSYDLVDTFCQADNLIIVDAMQAGGEPGTIYRVPLEDLGLKPEEKATSLHELHFIEAVRMVNLLGYYPQIVVFGIEPKAIEWGLDLTPEVEARLPKVIELIKDEIQKLIGS